MIYFDNAATTETDPLVADIVYRYLRSDYGNPSASYTFGSQLKSDIHTARCGIAKLINAGPEEVLFTSGGTESDNMALLCGAYEGLRRLRGADRGQPLERLIGMPGPAPTVITSVIEHPAVLQPVRRLASLGFRVIYIKPDEYGTISPDELKASMCEGTVLVSIMHANNEIGTIEDIASLARVAHSFGALFHTDAVQTLGHEHIDVRLMDIDLLSGSAHKLYGPKGIGLLYIRQGLMIEPLILGGGQEHGLRSGTENVPSIMGFGKAASLAYERLEDEQRYVAGLRDRLYYKLCELIDGVILNGAPLTGGRRLAGNLHVSFLDVEGTSLLIRLDMKGIYCSTGSACSQGGDKPSHVMLGIGASPDSVKGSVRFTLSRHNTEAEVDEAALLIAREVEFLRSIRL